MIGIPKSVFVAHLRATIESLKLSTPELADCKVREFIVLVLLTAAEEKVSDPDDWTPEQKAAFAAGDWRLFSKLRGYTAMEIETYARYLYVCNVVETTYGDPEDPYNHTAALSHQIHQCIHALSDSVRTEKSWESIEHEVLLLAAQNIGAAFDWVARGN